MYLVAPSYNYKARDGGGNVVKGSLHAPSRDKAALQLKAKDLYVICLQEKYYFKESIKVYLTPSMLGSRELMSFSRQLASLIKAGVPVLDSLKTISSQIEIVHLQRNISGVIDSLEAGESLRDAFRSSGEIFPAFYINMIGAGEEAGALEEVLQRLADYYEREFELNEKIKGALIYPSILMIAAVAVLYVLLTYILPEFVSIFRGMESELPLFTQYLLILGEFVKANIFIIFLCFILLYLLAKLTGRTNRGRKRLDKIKLQFPVLKNIVQVVTLARFSRMLSTLIGSGISLTRSLELVKSTINNRIIEEIIEESQENINKGYSFSSPYLENNFIPPLLGKMIAVGEQTGDLEAMLEKTANYFELESKYILDRVSSLIEPLLILVLVVVTGFIVISVVLPMMEIWQVF